MLYCNRIDVCKGIAINKANASKQCDICPYWYFLETGFKFQWDLCNSCNNILLMSMNFSNIAILNIHVADYCCVTSGNSKSEAINIIQNIDLTKNSGTL